MPDDRIAILEQRLAAVERAVAELKANGRPADPAARKDPLEGHPLLSKKMSPEEAVVYEAKRRKELGLEGVELVSAEELRQMMLDDGIDPNANEASRELIAMREEEG